MKVRAYIHSLKDHEHDRHVLGEAEIIECIGDNRYLAVVNGVRCTAIFNFFTGAYYVDDVYDMWVLGTEFWSSGRLILLTIELLLHPDLSF